ncbi:non-ribosomal peptide synthetase, partial [Thioclava sp. BHET1]
IPLTEGQREIWMVHQMGDRAAASFNEGLLLAMDGPLDPAALEGALADLVARRDALRMQFDRSGTTFDILDPMAPALPLVDLSGEGDPDAALAAHVEADAAIPVMLTAGLPLRAQLYRLGAARHVLALTVHHIAADGWSFGLMVADL